MSIAIGALIFPLSAKAECTLTSSGETRPTGTIIHNADHDVLQTCTNDGTWQALTPLVDTCDPARNPTPGTTCGNGTIYAGLSPDGDVPMYTTAADAPSTYSWNDGSPNWADTAMVNCTDGPPGTALSCETGEANTTFLVGLNGSGTPSPYAAAEYCDGLSANGFSDWYLPAQDELDVLFDNKNEGDLDGTFNETGSLPAGYYWSSSEYSSNVAVPIRFSGGSVFGTKDNGYAVRCVRK